MKRFIVKLLLFFLICIFLDIFLGSIFNKLKANSKGGEIGKIEYIADKMEDPILVFGSSRASHHYVPRILEDSLGLSAYNCGLDGNGIIFAYGQYCMFKNRYTPKLIIYDISGFDLRFESDNRKYINYLKINSDRPGVSDVIKSVDITEKYKMLSKSYCYNTHFVKVIIGSIIKTNNFIKGYLPIYKEMKYEPSIDQEPYEGKFDNLKLYYWKRFIEDCRNNGTNLILTISPRYKGIMFSEDYKPLFDLAKINGIPVINFYDDSIISKNKEFFYDSTHMNNKGAEFYTRHLVSKIKQLY